MRMKQPQHYKLRALNKTQRQLFYSSNCTDGKNKNIEFIHKYSQTNGTPNVLLIRDFITAQECESILRFVQDEKATFKASCCDGCTIDRSQRDSYDMLYPKFRFAAPVQRLCELIGVTLSNIECPQIIQYEEAGHFNLHHDTSPITDEDGHTYEPSIYSDEYIDMIHDSATYRTISCILYLDTTDDGHTYFPKLGVQQKPIKHSLLLWPNVTPEGGIEASTVHAGSYVSTTKRIVNLWVNSCLQ